MADELLREATRARRTAHHQPSRGEKRHQRAVAHALSDALDELTNDDGAWVVVLTGAGEKAFSAVMDLKAFASGDANIATGTAASRHRQAVVPQTPHRGGQRSPSPVASEIVLSCDMVVAADTPLRHPRGQRGLFAAGGGLIRFQAHPARLSPTSWPSRGDRSTQRALELGS